jgi:hypothetical protein
MRDAGYVIAGYLVTGGVVAAYAASVRLRLRRALRRTEADFPDRDAR